MKYNVKITKKAQIDLSDRIGYLKDVKKSTQAAKAVLEDYRQTRKILEDLAGAIAEPIDEELKKRGLKRINFRRHNYFMLFKIMNEDVIIVRIFHGLEDYTGKI
ncbi:MAG: type II toxin-antitoxin system RelE/ParE family toxin [Eubacterium sp.]|nr:type II toxin-antitoxin system RelE/ParE family toxin [Eubacterium sp.]